MRSLPDELNCACLQLRRPLATDADAIFDSYAQDPEVCRFMVWTPHASAVTTREFIASCTAAWELDLQFAYVIALRESLFAIGMLDARRIATGFEIGYVLAREHWGRGFMPEAIGAFVTAALASPDAFRVQATCDIDNIASQRALKKAGFHREGRLARHTIHPNLSSEPRACFIYALCR